ncbi:SEC-C metal-binding domain-containing protein [Patescibacteria group bacterium]
MDKKIPKDSKELEKQLDDQLELLSELAELYDQGKTVAAKSMATAIRVLLHDTKSSHSLLGQLGRKKVDFYDTAGTEQKLTEAGGKRLGSYFGLIGVDAKNSKYIPFLDDSPPGMASRTPLKEYWNRVIIKDASGVEFTRADIVLKVANEDGGAHVDPGLTDKYAKLSRENSMQITSGEGGMEKSVEGIEHAVIRQVGHEVLRTFLETYPQKEMKSEGAGFVLGGPPMLFKDKKTPQMLSALGIKSKKKVGRNETCPCGSGKKYKKCCDF